MTSTSSPPRIGSGHDHTGRNTQSDLSPVAWFVELPSKPQMGSSAPSARILVLLRSLAVGSVPSIQMYSARYTTVLSPSTSSDNDDVHGLGTLELSWLRSAVSSRRKAKPAGSRPVEAGASVHLPRTGPTMLPTWDVAAVARL